MKLKNNLYTIVTRELDNGKHIFIITLNSSCSIYAAHFPNMPITPGVCIIQIVEELLEDLIGCSCRLCTVKNAKFLSVLSPEGQEVFVTYSSVKEEKGVVDAKVTISDSNSNVYAKISLQAITA